MTYLNEDQEAIQHLLTSLIDLYNGWPVGELHEHPKLTVQRALNRLPERVREEFAVPADLR